MANDKKKMVEAITAQEVDFAQWYTDICTKAELVEYSSVKGFVVLRPYGYAIWENIQKNLDARFKATGHENVAMPVLIPESLLKKEGELVNGFAPEVAWVPAGGSAVLIYETTATPVAPLATGSSITNTATITGGGLTTPITAQATVETANSADLTISKALSPTTVTENGRITYTFVISNTGNTEATATGNVVVTDTFAPILRNIAVTYNGTAWTEGTNYTYNAATGVFTTLAGQITVPAASFTQNTDGTFTVTPGTATLVITGTV